jgi:hypothetical protein
MPFRWQQLTLTMIAMKYSLRSLMIAALVLPPLIGGGWFFLGPSSSYSFSNDAAGFIAIVLVMVATIVFISLRIALRP